MPPVGIPVSQAPAPPERVSPRRPPRPKNVWGIPTFPTVVDAHHQVQLASAGRS